MGEALRCRLAAVHGGVHEAGAQLHRAVRLERERAQVAVSIEGVREASADVGPPGAIREQPAAAQRLGHDALDARGFDVQVERARARGHGGVPGAGAGVEGGVHGRSEVRPSGVEGLRSSA